ncbi:MAG: hypothetical protein AAB601_01580 [Patescibacteria group bacterium]
MAEDHISSKSYLETLRSRQRDNRAHRRYQAVGAELAEMLSDRKHTALYIKLAMQFDEERLRALARSVAGRVNIKNPGAYFMRVLYGNNTATSDKQRETSKEKGRQK